MADGNRRKERNPNTNVLTEEIKVEELKQVLGDLNYSIINLSKQLQQLQKNIVNEKAQSADSFATKTLH